jgi:hypothetical protein
VRGPTPVEERGAEVDYQVAAPAEMGTPNWHRAKIAQKRVRMEGWRQRRLGSNARNPQEGRRKADLTLTGLLIATSWMDRSPNGPEYARNDRNRRDGALEKLACSERIVAPFQREHN